MYIPMYSYIYFLSRVKNMREKLSNPQMLRLPPKLLEDCIALAKERGVTTTEMFRMLLDKALYGDLRMPVKKKKK